MDTPFKPRAQILLQLGEQLIKNENIAILELVKNAYDADAKTAKVFLNKVDDPENGCIVISDDGSGMNIDTITNIWMEPGNIHKKAIVGNNIRSPLGRLPIGEKGIGRFGVHKLGKTIQLVSKQEGFKEVILEIDWSKFETAEYLDDIKIRIDEREPQVFVGGATGTYIKITNISSVWTKAKVRSLHRALNRLNSPFESDKSFRIKLYTDRPEWLAGIMLFEDIKDYALYECEAIIQGKFVTQFKYSFKPYELMKSRNITSRVVEADHPIEMKKEVWVDDKRVWENIDLSKYQIGDVFIKMYVFDRDTSILNIIPDKAAFKEYLNNNGGICVLRDGIRVLDYGEPGNDWLDLDANRVNMPSQRISNNLVLGAVYLDRATSSSLKEKANREGFIEDEAYNSFRDAVRFVIGRFTGYRNADKDVYKNVLKGGTKEPIKDDISEIRRLIKNTTIEEPIKKQLDSALDRIENEFEELKNRYVRTANAGMSYGIVIHEIEKIIGELKKAALDNGTSEKIRYLSGHLSRLIKNYSDLLRNKRKNENDLKEIIKQALFSVEYRLSAHNIIVENNAMSFDGESKVKCVSNLIVGAIINLIDNSIYWTTYSNVEERKIYISITDEIEGYTCIVLADNGLGYQLSGEDAIKPFVSLKVDGLGLGLNIVNEIMLSQNGKIVFPEKGDVTIPKEYSNGAVTLLAFKKEDE